MPSYYVTCVAESFPLSSRYCLPAFCSQSLGAIWELLVNQEKIDLSKLMQDMLSKSICLMKRIFFYFGFLIKSLHVLQMVTWEFFLNIYTVCSIKCIFPENFNFPIPPVCHWSWERENPSNRLYSVQCTHV